MSASSQYYSVTARVGVPHRHEVQVTIPLVGPAGATGPAGAAGASAWNDITGKPSTFAPSAHASTHHTGGSDPLTPANIGAAKDFTEIEVGNTGTSTTTLTTAQLPARVILFVDSDDAPTATINLPTPDARQSGLVASIKLQMEGGTADTVLITVVHNAVNLLTAYGLAEDEGSIDFRWDGYRWVYDANWLLRSSTGRVLELPSSSGTLALTESADNVFRIVGSADATKKVAFEVDTNVPTTSTVALTVPAASGTIARTQDFAAPPSIGSTTPAAGSFTTLNASGTTELVNGGTTAGPFRLYNQSNSATNFERLNLSWASNVAIIGTEKGSAGGTARALAFQTDGTTKWTIVTGGDLESAGNGVKARNCNLGVFGPADFAIVSNTAGIRLGVSDDTSFFREAAGTLGQYSGTQAQEYRLYATRTSASNFQRMNVKSVRQTLSALSGASATTTGTFIPDGAVVVGVTTRVTTLLATAVGYQVGDGTDADRWGDITGTAVGTTSDNRDWTAGTIECFTAGGNITLTAKTSNFTAGAIEICVFYLAGEAD